MRKTEPTPTLEALGEDLKGNTDQSLNFLARQYGLARRTAQRYVKKTPKLRPTAKIKASALSDAHREKRKTAADTYLRLPAEGALNADEKLFRAHCNSGVGAKDARAYIPKSADKRGSPTAPLTVAREKNGCASARVAGGVCLQEWRRSI